MSRNYRVNLTRVPTIEEIRSLIAKIRKINGIDQIIPVDGRPWLDFTLHPGANESTARSEVNKQVKAVSRDLL